MSEVFAFACTAAFNPTLLAATTVMLLMPSPKRLLLGYLIGASMTSITLGLLIVFQFEESSTVSTAETSLSPAQDIVIGALLVIVGFAIRGERHQRRSERRAAARAAEPKKEPRWQKVLGKGSPRWTFAAGALLTLPGASYLAGLAQISKLDPTNTETVILVVAFNLIMLALLEVPLLGYFLAPDRTPGVVRDFKAALSRHGGRILSLGALGLGGLLMVRGVVELLLA